MPPPKKPKFLRLGDLEEKVPPGARKRRRGLADPKMKSKPSGVPGTRDRIRRPGTTTDPAIIRRRRLKV